MRVGDVVLAGGRVERRVQERLARADGEVADARRGLRSHHAGEVAELASVGGLQPAVGELLDVFCYKAIAMGEVVGLDEVAHACGERVGLVTIYVSYVAQLYYSLIIFPICYFPLRDVI